MINITLELQKIDASRAQLAKVLNISLRQLARWEANMFELEEALDSLKADFVLRRQKQNASS